MAPERGEARSAEPVLVDTAADGDVEAEFVAFARSASPGLGRFAYLLCGDAHRADELLQQTLVKTYVAWSRARRGEPLAYARAIMAHQRTDWWRRQRREVLTDPATLRDLAHDAGRTTLSVQDQRLVTAFQQLPDRWRAIIVMRFVLDLPEREVADELGVALGTVKSATSRGLARLRRELDDHEGG